MKYYTGPDNKAGIVGLDHGGEQGKREGAI